MINEKITFGIDLGIGSCGWAVIKHPFQPNETGTIEGLGSWCFDVPEAKNDKTPKNQIRRTNRLLRRVIRRRRRRMVEIRQLFHHMDLLPSSHSDSLKHPGCDPWELRAKGLDEPLTKLEFCIALGHIAKRRGFKSTAKTKAKNASSDDKKMLAALDKTKERLARYRTVGEMFARDPEFSSRRRNREGFYDRTSKREDLRYEVTKLFSQQRKMKQHFASCELEEQFIAIAFRQLQTQDSERLVGNCIFEVDEKRCSKLAPSFERFRLLTRLINLRVKTVEGERSLTPAELAKVTADIGKEEKLSVQHVRTTLLKLSEDERFTTIKKEDEKHDIVARKGEAMPGSYALRKSIGEKQWQEMQNQLHLLDEIAHILSFFEKNESIAEKLSNLHLKPEILESLLKSLDAGKFAKFKGTGHISAKACRNLLPHLEQGYRYDIACQRAGYNHTVSSLSNQDQILNKAQFNALVAEMGENIANPIARKALTEGLKQLWAMRHRYGLPGSIHIELARDVGNSLKNRQKIKRKIDKTTAQREREREKIQELLKLTEVNSNTLLRYRLWKEQGEKCLYSGNPIDIKKLIDTDNSVQVDHILPWSRFGDDSFNNKTLTLASENQRKKGQTPYEWFSREKSSLEWETFVQRIETSEDLHHYKKRNFLLKNAEDAAKKFRSRNLNDTRYAARLLAEAAKFFYPAGERQEKDGKRRVFTRPGALTAALRKAWGLESLKKINDERVADDRHHALDALAVAAISEGEVQRLTKSFQKWEQQGLGRPLRYVSPPWANFRTDVLNAYNTICVARPQRCRARGEGHKATVKQIKEHDGKTIVYERKATLALIPTDLKKIKNPIRIKDPERNSAIVEAIRAWQDADYPKDALPRSPKGDIINKVRLETQDKPAVSVRGGTADRGDMVRVDVFSKPNKKGVNEWYLVPIYPHQVMNKKAWPHPPQKAVIAHKPEKEWPDMDASYKFCFSLYPHSYMEITKKTGEIIEGYFAGVDRATGVIDIKSANIPKKIFKRVGAKTLLSIKKYNIDRFGIRSPIKREVRTWHGAVCTFPNQHD